MGNQCIFLACGFAFMYTWCFPDKFSQIPCPGRRWTIACWCFYILTRIWSQVRALKTLPVNLVHKFSACMVHEFIATNGTVFCFLVLSIERVFGCRHFRVLNSQETCNARNWRGVAYGFRQHSDRLSLYKDVFIALGPVQDNFFSKIVLRCILQKWYHAFRHMFFFLDFHLSFVFHVFKHLIPNGFSVCFSIFLPPFAGLDPKCIMDFKEIYEELE